MVQPKRVWFSRYALKPRFALNSQTGAALREGVLLRVEFQNQMIGYADCHPLLEACAEPLQKQLEYLTQGQLTQTLKASLLFASIDAEARSNRLNLFSGLEIPRSHAIDTALLGLNEQNADLLEKIRDLHASGFKRLKLKIRDPLNQIEFLRTLAQALPADFLLRLDLNSSATEKEMLAFAEQMESSFKEKIEFIEDPCPYTFSSWDRLADKIPIAADFEQVTDPKVFSKIRYQILKPAWQANFIFEHVQMPSHATEIFKQKSYVITSAMDHPVGQMFAAWTAVKFAKSFPDLLKDCGLLTHQLFLPNAFSEALSVSGPFLKPQEGFGIGFDLLFERIDWKELR